MPTPNPRPPLGLPPGSVRALLTLMVVAVVISVAVRGEEVPLLWTETLMIALAHYFTSRRFLQLPPEVLQRLEDDGYLAREARPLFLPRHTIRSVIILAFVGLAIYLYREGRILQYQSLTVLATVFAYFLGILAGLLMRWWQTGRQPTGARWWNDLKALAALLVTAVVAGFHLAGHADLVPRLLENAALGLALFYFGSR